MFRSLPGDPDRTNAWLASLWGGEPAPETRKILRDAAAAVEAPVALESYESWSSLDFADEAATIVTPTLVIAPERDRPFTPAYLRERVANPIAGSRFEVVPGAGHLVPLERPAELAGLIERFVDAL
jgi:pimeloyl-ACP methyl ester carboxylesterase